ncbi:MAG: alpha/beta fold hydrolase [Nostoc sp. DedSLP03]|uniref:esterase/lipase family protein n=1 Tax=Nostoc sp. DedSLP03 TaxID=3075400 RepID=UPI002AD3D37D|nr:alpha/beta fold hydrolase [Nostoc sp. DedSLP03]MDZ7969734.1 alpha/beta fold hydrolase [Nostoc sp. DedSLP03]
MYEDKIQQIRERGDELITFEEKNKPYPKAKTQDFLNDKQLVILIHGFTSHGDYMGEELAPFLEREGYQVFFFNYNSPRGILAAVNTLKDILKSYDKLTRGEISRKKVFLIAHSMGGLVARGFTIDNDAKKFVRGIVMLGTPNNGVFQNKKDFIKYLIDAGEMLSGAFPKLSVAGCIATKELCKIDENENQSIIDILNSDWCQACELPSILSVSGGKKFLDFYKSEFKNKVTNDIIQKLIGNEENDGIVTESSVNMPLFIETCTLERYKHCNSYADYSETNHNNIHLNQRVMLKILSWLRKQNNLLIGVK